MSATADIAAVLHALNLERELSDMVLNMTSYMTVEQKDRWNTWNDNYQEMMGVHYEAWDDWNSDELLDIYRFFTQELGLRPVKP